MKNFIIQILQIIRNLSNTLNLFIDKNVENSLSKLNGEVVEITKTIDEFFLCPKILLKNTNNLDLNTCLFSYIKQIA